MLLKSRIKVYFLVLTLAAGVGFYYFGRGGKLDTNGDRDVLLHIDYQMERAQIGLVFVYINDVNRTDDSFRNSWDDHMWVRPGERIRLDGHVQGKGRLTCVITDDKHSYRNSVTGQFHWSDNICSITYVGS